MKNLTVEQLIALDLGELMIQLRKTEKERDALSVKLEAANCELIRLTAPELNNSDLRALDPTWRENMSLSK